MQTALFPSEKKSLRRFLTIYILSTFTLIAVGSAIFYQYAYHRLIDHQNDTLKIKTSQIKPKLRKLHNTLAERLPYPVVEGVETALYDIDRHYLAGQFRPEKVRWNEEFWREGDTLYYRMEQQPYYLGAATVVAATKLDAAPIRALRLKMAAAIVAALLFVAFVARWLGHLFLAPVHQTMQMLDRFIKDSTHELNTPVSTILTNAELFKSMHPELEKSEELRRIETASKRLSRIYDDLAYLQLNHRRHRQIEKLDMARLLEERLDYFRQVTGRKGIALETEVEEGVTLEMDREDAMRLVDNLLSNAVKYTPPGGRVKVTLSREGLAVEDTGVGMDETARRKATERFFRAEKSEGGFGLGLNIVAEIVEHYGMRLTLESQKEKGTKVRVSW
ncbi:sensor histidine kinase [Hydrogenimonas sp.]